MSYTKPGICPVCNEKPRPKDGFNDKGQQTYKATCGACNPRDDLNENNWKSVIFIEARKRAKKKGIEYSLTKKDEKKLVNESDGRSDISGMVFCFEKIPGVYRRPWIPSLDRIKSDKGYTKDNVRIINCFENNMLNQFGWKVVVKGCSAIVQHCLYRCIR